MFIPNTNAVLLRKAAKRDIHGRESYGPAIPIRVSVVSLAEAVVESSVRADSTASRGAADQAVLQAKLLVLPDILLGRGDVIQVLGRNVEIASIQPRVDVLGSHDHNEVGGNIKGDMP
jgi:hypothetical protein